MSILIRICAHLTVFNNFLKSSLNNAQDMRFLLLNYLATNPTGKDFIKQLFATFMDMNLDLLLFNKTPMDKNTSTPMDTNEEVFTDKPSSSFISSLGSSTTSVLRDQDVKIKKVETTFNSEECTLYLMTMRAHKNIIDLIVYMGKTFCNFGVRHHRSLESQVIKDTHAITEELFNGLSEHLRYGSQMPGDNR